MAKVDQSIIECIALADKAHKDHRDRKESHILS